MFMFWPITGQETLDNIYCRVSRWAFQAEGLACKILNLFYMSSFHFLWLQMRPHKKRQQCMATLTRASISTHLLTFEHPAVSP